MSRQLFLPQHKGKHFCFDERGIKSNQSAAFIIANIITEWSRTEHQMTMVLAALLGDNPNGGVALFSTLRNARAQRDALQAVADITLLDSELRALFDAVINAVIKIGKSRNDLAHGVLGWSFDLPGLTLWVASRDIASYEAKAWILRDQIPQSGQMRNHDELEKLIFYYTNDELNRILEETKSAKLILFDLYGIIRHSYDVASEQYHQLSTEPHVFQELNR